MKNQYNDTKAFVFLFSGKELPVEMNGPRITTTGKGDGLIMTHNKAIYQFICDSKNSCYFVKEDNELQIGRQNHVFLSVPTSLVKDC